MSKYFLHEYNSIWQDVLKIVLGKGTKICQTGANWELWLHEDMVYSIPIVSGCGPSYWCPARKLREHLCHLRRIHGYDKLIPSDWEDVNLEALASCGVCDK